MGAPIVLWVALLLAEGAGATGFEEAVAPDPGDRPLQVGIWSPSGNETPLPLIVLSHGTGGSYEDLRPTAVALAEAGFVVVGVTHTGNNFRDNRYVAQGRHLVERPRHVARVLDHMLTKWAARDRIDPERIGMFGFSAGAFTALVIIGGEADFSRAAALCREHPEAADCDYWKRYGRTGSNPSVPSWIHDARVKAAVVVAPAAGYTFAPSGLSNVRVPVQLWAGTSDRIVDTATSTAVVRKLLSSPPEYHEVEDATHFSFLGPCPSDLQAIMLKRAQSGEVNPCLDPPGFDRTAFYERFKRDVVAFFSRTLKGR
jgi:predicted dienelactone hydrolase